MVKELELEERKVAVQEAVAQTSKQKVEGHISIEQLQMQIDQMQVKLEDARKQRELDIKEYDVTSKSAIAVQELQQAKDMIAADPASGKAIVSPN
jgi:oligoribonuclease NrnB/cAMP/cGMP phosphodiesterase (DHH superfamily)